MKFAGNGIMAKIQHAEGAVAASVPVLQLNNVNPATFVVGPTEIGKFHVGDSVLFSGAVAPATAANGTWAITAINNTTGVITIGSLNGTTWTGGPFTTAGMAVKPVSNAINVPILGVSLTKPAVVTVAAGNIDLFDAGSLVTIKGTGSPLIDNMTFQIGTVSGSTFQLKGSDMRKASVAPTTGIGTPIDPADMLLFCLTSFSQAVSSANPIDTTTFCGVSSLPGTPAPGTVSIEAYVDYDELAYAEFLNGMRDGLTRVMTIEPPIEAGGGIIIYRLTPSGFTEDFAVGAASSFKGEATLENPPVYIVGALT